MDKDGVEGVIQGIPDRTISVLLNHLSDIRGDNIVCDSPFLYPPLVCSVIHLKDPHSRLLQLSGDQPRRGRLRRPSDPESSPFVREL